jgi:hypothetical protein
MVLAAIACRHGGGVAPGRECHDGWCMPKRKTPKAWTVYKIAKIGKRLGVVYGETEKEALANAQKEFAKTEAEKKAASSWAKRVRKAKFENPHRHRVRRPAWSTRATLRRGRRRTAQVDQGRRMGAAG